MKPDGRLKGKVGVLLTLAAIAAFGGARATAEQPKERATLEGGTEQNKLTMTADGKVLVSASKEIKLWDLATGKELRTIQPPAQIWSVAITPDGKLVAAADFDGKLRLWDAATGKEQAVLKGHPGVFSPWYISSLTFTCDGKTLVSGGADGKVKLWDVATGEEKATFKVPRGSVMAVAISPDGKTLAAALALPARTSSMLAEDDTTGRILVWDVATGEERGSLMGSGATVMAMVMTPDSKMILSADMNGKIKFLNLANVKEEATINAHPGILTGWPIWSISLSGDGRTLASSSLDGTVKLWDVSTRKKKATLPGHQGGVWAVALSPDGKTLASAGFSDTVIKLWDVPTPADPTK
jgi:WD40 repeat protein